MSSEIPSYLSGREVILRYNYDEVDKFVDSENDNSFYIHNLSVSHEKTILCKKFFKSIMFGSSHHFIGRLIKPSSNICLPLLHSWNGPPQIDNLVIISHPDDAERICKTHIKKAPIFQSFLYDSIISTRDNTDWKNQRGNMNMAFIPKMSLKKVFPESLKRASECCELLKVITHNYRDSVNISEFFLNETQAQLQLSMFGFSNEFQENTNKKIRQAFSGINTEYTQEFSKLALRETQISDGPLSKIFDMSDDPLKNIGNILIFAFAGHDTTGHTLSWLMYELCRHPIHKRELINEIDAYWKNHSEPTYETFKELPFMTKCLTETLRLWPALANGTYRELDADDTVTGINGDPVHLSKGTYCQIINWTRHRNPDLWGDDVELFNPNREFKRSEIWDYVGFGTTNVSSDRFSPFTYGPRNCIGKNFSHMEMRLILLHLFREFDFEFAAEQPQNINGMNTFTMGPKSYKDNEMIGLYLRVFQRRSRI
jgi:cytochrome P450